MNTDPARQAFDRLYGHLNLSAEDAAWHVFKSGWDAREQPAPAQFFGFEIVVDETMPPDELRLVQSPPAPAQPPAIQHLPADDTEGGAP